MQDGVMNPQRFLLLPNLRRRQDSTFECIRDGCLGIDHTLLDICLCTSIKLEII